MLIIKQYLSVRNLYDRTGKISGNMNTVIAGGLSSYGLVLMVFNFLQVCKVDNSFVVENNS